MAAEREPPSLADHVVTAISPALIMLMVGSLVFFLITVLPTGEYKERLLYTSFFFVFGAVLVARISIQYDAARAGMYGLGLGLVTFLAMSAYVDYPSGTWMKPVGWLLNLGLMGLIWWSAHKLTWDCTYIDETQDASGRGVLSAAGLDQDSGDREQESEAGNQESGEDSKRDRKKKRRRKRANPERKRGGQRPSAFSTWTARWWKHHEEQKKKPHTPGVWVVYFSLAALPLFAIGQSLIPRDDADRRWTTFVQMAVYVGSGLGLLVTTSLLGLRRYLRQKKARIPVSLNVGWLGLGGLLIAVFLVIGAFFPRPHSEVPWFGLPQAGKSDRNASDYAQLRNSAGKGDGREGEVAEKGEGKATGKNGKTGGRGGEKGDGGGKGKSSGGKEGKGKDQQGKSGSDAKSGRDDSESSRDKDDRESRTGGQTERDGDEASEGNRGRDRSSSSRSEAKLGQVVEKVAGFAKWLVIAIVVILIVIGLALAVLRYLSPFTEWARHLLDALRNWWANLFGARANPERERGGAIDAPLDPPRPPPFSAFSNPFDDGTSDGRQVEELVEYTFAALDSWAWDRGHGRLEAETPLEFATRLGDEFPDLAANLRKLANLYARVAYSELPLPPDTNKLLEQVWDQLIHGATAAEPVAVDEA